MRAYLPLVAFAAFVCSAAAQETSDNPKDRVKAVRELGKGGAELIPQLAPYLKDTDNEVRQETVRSLTTIGTQHSLPPLVEATRDNDASVQIRAVDGLVNFYAPGYLKSGVSKFSSAVRSRFDRENTLVVDPYVRVREDVIAAIGRVARGGSSMESRANAARALGILRAKESVPDLLAALQTKDDAVLFEALIALQKIGDQTAGPKVLFLMRDLHEPVQLAAIETAGLLKAKDSVPELQKLARDTDSPKVRRAALTSLSMLPTPASRPMFDAALTDKNDGIRASGAEGLGRLKDASDLARVEKAFTEEKKMAPRLALAFAAVSLGNTQTGEFAPLTYLVNTLNSKSYREVARPYLAELAREAAVRGALYGYLKAATREEKTGLATVFASSGDSGSVPQLEWMSKDTDPEVAQEALRALRTLKTRL
jgi:HEAT repeat protein